MRNYIEIFRNIEDKSVKYHNAIACRCELPTCNGNIKWSKTIGYTFDFSYKGFDGELVIVDYDIKRRMLSIKINNSNDVFKIGTHPFINVGFKEIIRIRYHKYNIDDIVANKKILDISYSTEHRSIVYKYKCLNDGYEDYVYEHNLKHSLGLCPVCTNHKVLVGYNDIPTTDSWMIDYFQGGYDEAKLYLSTTSKKIIPKCPHCKRISKKSIAIYNIYRNKGFSCKCSDKISYPEKCMINLLDILNIDYLYQCGNNTLAWIKGKYSYDFYIKSMSMMIETHGEQHFKEGSTYSKWGSLKENQERDYEKESMALNNGIKHYITLDCSQSNIEQFKESVMKSKLPVLLNFAENDIDWNNIDILSTRNIVKEICEYKEENPHLLLSEVAEVFHVSSKILTKYYHIGDKYGWCTYNKQEMRWIGHFHRNTHYSINGHLFYNTEDITNRSKEVLGEKICGSSVCTYMRNGSQRKPFKNKYEVKTLTHKEYLIQNTVYPEYISKKVIEGLLKKYS